MPSRPAASPPGSLDRCFVKELAGENPPSFVALRSLYGLASQLYALHPWGLLHESQLVLVRDSASGELCHCSVMGSLGQVYAMHAYVGSEGLRMFRKIERGEITESGEFYASQRSVYVDFAVKAELHKPDRELLTALGHPWGRGIKCPIFRAVRPGFYPWFVTAEEVQLLAECIRAVIVVCSAVAAGSCPDFWDEDNDVYPLVSHVASGKSNQRIEPMKLVRPTAPPLVPVRLEEESLARLRGKDHAVGGVMELDHMFSAVATGDRNERKSCTCVALAVDADTGFLYAPELTSSSVPPAEAMAQAFVNAVQATRMFPREVRVRHESFRDCLGPLLHSFDVAIRVQRRLPAMDEARAGLTAFFS